MDLKKITAPEVQLWITENLQADIPELAMKKSLFSTLEMRELVQQVQGRRVASKKFELLDRTGAVFPPKINLEQTSSATTAKYKSGLISGGTLIDITGGFGIDSLYFSEKCKRVIHVESNKELQSIAAHNFQLLGKNNLESIAGDGVEYLRNFDGCVDAIYVDPSRRDEEKNRVFLLNDLQPVLPQIIDLLWEKTNVVLIKLSPLIDISYLLEVFPECSEIHLVAVKNELKEILVKLEKNTEAETRIMCVNLKSSQPLFRFNWNERLSTGITYGNLAQFVYEPNVTIQKSGGLDLLGKMFGLDKLHANTQLFTSAKLHKDFPGRVFEVLNAVKNPKKELKNRSIQAIHRNFPQGLKKLQKQFRFQTDGTEPILFAQGIEKVYIYRMREVNFNG